MMSVESQNILSISEFSWTAGDTRDCCILRQEAAEEAAQEAAVLLHLGLPIV